MAQSKLLIIGDSFCYNQEAYSWTKMINDYEVCIDSACGIGEYKIWRKVLNHDLKEYHKIIIVHTSPYRLHINQNPWYDEGSMHNQADLLYCDIKNKPSGIYKQLVCDWFEKVVELDHLENIHQLIVKEIQSLCQGKSALHMTFFEYQLPGVCSINNIWKQNPGSINHLDRTGNCKTLDFLLPFLQDKNH